MENQKFRQFEVTQKSIHKASCHAEHTEGVAADRIDAERFDPCSRKRKEPTLQSRQTAIHAEQLLRHALDQSPFPLREIFCVDRFPVTAKTPKKKKTRMIHKDVSQGTLRSKWAV